MASKNITYGALDFDSIKSSLKTFLSGQAQFKDYDFEGAGLSVLLDLLAYNTQYRVLYDNLALGESFLDSASKRASVVSHAQSLGYFPASTRSARTSVQLDVFSATQGADIISLPAGTPFKTSINGVNYVFYTDSIQIASTVDHQNYSFKNVTLIEGKAFSYRYIVADGVQYIIPNQSVDTSTLAVSVLQSASSTDQQVFTLATDLTSVDDTSTVYWLKEIQNGLYELTFGDGNLGVALEPGNVVNIQYMVSSADAVNGAKAFTYAGQDVLPGARYSVITLSPAAGGAQPEGIEAIRFNAPQVRAAQNRAVTAPDYRAMTLKAIPSATSVSVWGGDENDPPMYGKVFICVQPSGAARLTQQQKSDLLTTILSPKNMLTAIPEIVDPEQLNVQLKVTVKYDPNQTVLQAADIEALVLQSIKTYNATDLQKFDSVLRYTKLMRVIDGSDQSILSNTTVLTIRRPINPMYDVSSNYNINIVNPIYRSLSGSISTTGFYIDEDPNNVYYMDDDGAGNIRLFYLDPSANKIVRNPRVGTVDYTLGKIGLQALTITAIAGSLLELIIIPASNDVVSAYTQVAQIDFSNLSITALPDTSKLGLGAGTDYVFSAARQ